MKVTSASPCFLWNMVCRLVFHGEACRLTLQFIRFNMRCKCRPRGVLSNWKDILRCASELALAWPSHRSKNRERERKERANCKWVKKRAASFLDQVVARKTFYPLTPLSHLSESLSANFWLIKLQSAKHLTHLGWKLKHPLLTSFCSYFLPKITPPKNCLILLLLMILDSVASFHWSLPV